MTEERFIEFAKSNLELIQVSISENYPFTKNELLQVEELIDWESAIWNTNISWSIELIEMYKSKWTENSFRKYHSYDQHTPLFKLKPSQSHLASY